MGKGLSCFGKPKGTDIDGEYKANANIKSHEIDVKPFSTPNVEIDTSIAINIPDPKGDFNASVDLNEPEFKINTDIPDISKIKSNLYGNTDIILTAVVDIPETSMPETNINISVPDISVDIE